MIQFCYILSNPVLLLNKMIFAVHSIFNFNININDILCFKIFGVKLVLCLL